jgi:tryptophanyl-tRNA synthetase
MHLGQYVDVVRQWLDYQDSYECFFMIADIQTLTTHAKQPRAIAESVRSLALDWLAAGLDPRRSCFVVQSQLPELAELTLYLQTLVQATELRENPTVREEARLLGQRDPDLGFLGYPVAQVADILCFTTTPPAHDDTLIVPVGEDQLPHIDLARTLAQRFNEIYERVFLEPVAKTTPAASLPGTDGGYRMGKRPRNSILLIESEEEFAPKIRAMFTDPLRAKREDPGHPDECTCYTFFRAFGLDPEELSKRRTSCLAAETDCEDCKQDLIRETEKLLLPLRERRAEFARDPVFLEDVLTEGTRRAREVAGATLGRVREAMSLDYKGLIRKTT